VLAHPWRLNSISRYQPEWAPLLSAMEIWNRKYDGFAPHREVIEFADREGFAPFVSLDFHTRHQFFPLAMSISLASEPSPASLVERYVAVGVTQNFWVYPRFASPGDSKERRFALSRSPGEACGYHSVEFRQRTVDRSHRLKYRSRYGLTVASRLKFRPN
jgi:hypothetical protein